MLEMLDRVGGGLGENQIMEKKVTSPVLLGIAGTIASGEDVGGGSRSCLEKVILLVSLPLTVMEQYSVENWIPLCAGWNASFVSDEIPLNRTGCCVTLVPLS